MKINRYQEVGGFLNRVEDFLLAEEEVNNLPLGILYRLVQEKNEGEENSSFLACVEGQTGVTLVMIMTPSQNLIVYGTGSELPEAIETTVDFMIESNIQLPGVIGNRSTAQEFAKIWVERTGTNSFVQMEQGIYKLDKIIDFGSTQGRLKAAAKRDEELASEWIYAFSREALERISRNEAEKLAKKLIDRKSLYLWVDDKVVSMAGKSRPTKNGYTVNLVYTPPEFRRRGYATACVASLSRQILNEGYSFCTLYTDLANPTSNHIYRKIGYQPVEDSVVYEFK